MSIEDLQRIGVRLAFDRVDGIGPAELIRTFHHWIQARALPGVLIDVADYSHVSTGPGVMLVAHEGNWAVDVSSAEPGLTYVRKTTLEGPFGRRVPVVVREALRAATLLERDEQLGNRFSPRTDHLLLFANDRLRAPANGVGAEGFRRGLDELLRSLYLGRSPEIEITNDRRERPGVALRGTFGGSFAEALSRLAAAD